jgi:hypothetical protein
MSGKVTRARVVRHRICTSEPAVVTWAADHAYRQMLGDQQRTGMISPA